MTNMRKPCFSEFPQSIAQLRSHASKRSRVDSVARTRVIRIDAENRIAVVILAGADPDLAQPERLKLLPQDLSNCPISRIVNGRLTDHDSTLAPAAAARERIGSTPAAGCMNLPARRSAR